MLEKINTIARWTSAILLVALTVLTAVIGAGETVLFVTGCLIIPSVAAWAVTSFLMKKGE